MSGHSELTTSRLARTARPVMIVASVSGAILCVGGFYSSTAFFRASLFAWLFCLSAALGGMAIVMLHHLTGGRWGWPIRRLGEAASATLPMVSLAFLPIVLGASRLFPWADHAAVSASATLRHRVTFFTPPLVFTRAAIFFAIWNVLAFLLRRWSIAHDRDADPRSLARLRSVSAIGLVAIFVTMSLATVDWIASREVDWYSSTIGLVTLVGQVTTGLSVLIVALSMIQLDRREAIGAPVVHDLANLLQTVVVLWAYVSFMQYLVIWSGNTQEDIVWFHHRTVDLWNAVGITLIVGHFAVPFVLLLFQRVKRNLKTLAILAAGILVMRALDGLWTVAPSSPNDEPGHATLLDPIALLTLGGLWWWYFVYQCGRHPLVPRASEYAEECEPERSHVADAVIN